MTKKIKTIAFALSICMLSACTGENNSVESRKERGEEISEFKSGRALCNQGPEKGWIIIDESGEQVSALGNLLEEPGQGYMLFAIADPDNSAKSTYTIVDGDYNATETSIGHFLSEVNGKGNAWVPRDDDKPGFMMVDIKTATPKTDRYSDRECSIEYIDDSGLTVLSRNKSAFDGGSYGGASYYEYELISPDGDVLIPFGQLGFIGTPQNGRILFSTNGHFLYQSEYEYDHNSYLKDKAKTTSFKDAKVGYLDYNGQVVIPDTYDLGRNFEEDGTATVGIGDFYTRKTFRIDTEGNRIAQ